jgi:ribosomal protein L2
MAIKKVKPTSPGRRFQTYSSFEEITRTTPEKRLLKAIRKSGGPTDALPSDTGAAGTDAITG